MKKIILLLALAAVLLGCFGNVAPEQLAREVPEVKAYLEANPGTVMQFGSFSREAFELEKLWWETGCEKEIPTRGYYFVIIDNEGEKFFALFERDDMKIVCSFAGKVGSTGELVCIENWVCGNWGVCKNGTQERACTDLSDCGIEEDKPALSKACEIECTEDWSCTEWAECIDGMQTRTCTDLDSCGTDENKPEETYECGEPCTEKWNCTPWSDCTGGNQTRDCNVETNCETVVYQLPLIREC